MYKIGQTMLIVAVLAMLVISALLIVGSIDGKISGGIYVLALILAGAGSNISRKYKGK